MKGETVYGIVARVECISFTLEAPDMIPPSSKFTYLFHDPIMKSNVCNSLRKLERFKNWSDDAIENWFTLKATSNDYLTETKDAKAKFIKLGKSIEKLSPDY